MLRHSNKGITTIKGILILVVVAIIAFGAVFAYRHWWQPEEGDFDAPKAKLPEKPISLERPSNVSAYIWSLYLDALEGKRQFESNGQLIELTNLLCSIETTHKLSYAEENELKQVGVDIIRYTGYKHHFYIATFPALIIPELTKLEFVRDVRSAWESPTLEGVDLEEVPENID